MPFSSPHRLDDPPPAIDWPVPHYLTGPISPADTDYSPVHHPVSLPHLAAMAIPLPFHQVYNHPSSFADHILPLQHSLPNDAYAYAAAAADLDMQRLLMNDPAAIMHDPAAAAALMSARREPDELLSPISVQSYLSAAHTHLSPSTSPTDLRPPHDFPPAPATAGMLHAHAHDHSPDMSAAHALPLPSGLPEQHTLLLDSPYLQLPKPPPQLDTDPYAAAFLQEQLGDDKWGIFSARLYERRLGGPKARSRARKHGDAEPQRNAGASALDFLIKVEVVKEVLRIYVPHPYNPFKSLTHPYDGAPEGVVTLTRSTVLALSGWSNTQFSYWARRAEAICVLAPYDELLHSVAVALARRLHATLPPAPPSPSSSTAVSPLTSPVSATNSIAADPDAAEPAVTGKGLDQLIDVVKRRTGQSPFLRGKHASLDPFGAPGSPPAALACQPTFQAQMYEHAGRASARKRRRRDSGGSSTDTDGGGYNAYIGGAVPIKAEVADMQVPVQDARRVFFKVSDSRASSPPALALALGMPRELFPVSDSRFDRDRDRGVRKRARMGAA
ncbi:hypothetical protein FA95DRAFT_1572971 [Auriscalpium vulgare]|uniref:Uncharacterized protein n=1 Tax=Auriscalpium vulgare TaxID=40419 RepID=A0ACB8RRA2_9AGAM|nr:hypothetical protein FA95DRAFT_1572971 [Auriscalpium vulgare]